MKKIVILGGGFSGINVANKIAKKSKRKDVRIILVEPGEHNVYEPHYLFWSFNTDPIKKFTIPIDKVLNRRVQHLRSAAKHIDTKNKSIELPNSVCSK